MSNVVYTIPKDNEGKSIWKFFVSELKPKGKAFTPFNIISLPIMILGLVLIVIRFWKGIGSITNLTQDVPWGLWIGFDVVTGVAFAGGAYVLTFMVYILNMHKYHSIVRVTVLNGFLAYVFYAGALLLDLGRPWNVINPIIGNSFGDYWWARDSGVGDLEMENFGYNGKACGCSGADNSEWRTGDSQRGF